MDEKFDMGIYIYCVKSDGYVKEGTSYYIDSCGDMSYAPTRPKKIGYGFGIVSQEDNSKYYYTLEEMYEFFMTSDEYYPIWKRNNILQDILK